MIFLTYTFALLPAERDNRMKGQLFIIAMIFIVIAIVLIRNMVGTFELTEENRFQSTRLIEKNLRNIQNEFRNTAALAALQANANASGNEYLRNFSLQLRDDLDISIMYVYIVANGTNQNYSVTVGNFLKDRMNVTFNATNSTPANSVYIVEDKQNISTSYNITGNGTISANVSYTSQNQDITEKFNITDNTKNNIFLFTDITVRSNEFFVRGKNIYNWSWPV